MRRASLKRLLIAPLLTVWAGWSSGPQRTVALHDPVWAPNGRSIAYYSDETGNFEVYVKDLATGVVHRITNDPGYDGAPAWLPDGRLSFVSNRDGDNEIFIIAVDGTGLQQLTRNTTGELSHAWSPDGRRVAFETRRDGNDDIFELRVDTREERRVTDDPSRDFRPSYSPDGATIVFQSNRYGTMDLFTVRASGGPAALLLGLPGAQVTPAWSPDGLSIAFAGHRDGKVSLYAMSMQTGEVTELTGASSSGDSFPQWSPRGDAIVFLRAHNGASEIAVFNLGSRRIETVHRGALPAGSPAHDGVEAISQIRVTYVANEGVLLRSRGCRILIDALFRDGVPGYDYRSPALTTRANMEAARSPFDSVDLVLITHRHLDHFDSAAVAAHLASNPLAEVIAPPEVMRRVEAALDSARGPFRLHPSFPVEGRSDTIGTHCGAVVEVFNLHHGRTSPIQNVGFLIRVDGTTILHVGDTYADGDDMLAAGVGRTGVDIALLPYSHLVMPQLRDAVRQVLRPRHIVALHVPKPTFRSEFVEGRGGWAVVLGELRTSFRNAVVAERELETWIFER